MSKLDELDINLIETWKWFLEQNHAIGSKADEFLRLAARKYYELGKQEMKEEADTAIYQLEIMNAEVKRAKQKARQEEREGIKKACEARKKEITTDYRDNNEYSQGYNNALSDLLNELNKN